MTQNTSVDNTGKPTISGSAYWLSFMVIHCFISFVIKLLQRVVVFISCRGNAKTVVQLLGFTNMAVIRRDGDFQAMHDLLEIAVLLIHYQRNKFITAHTAQQIWLAESILLQPAELLQCCIAGFMALAVIDAFEVIQIKINQRGRQLLHLAEIQHMLGAPLKTQAI